MSKDIPCDQLHNLFMEVGWSNGKEPSLIIEKYNIGFLNSTISISAWDNERLVGCVRVLSNQFFRSVIYDLANDKLVELIKSGFEIFLWAGYKNFTMPLNEVFPEEMLSELEPYFIYYDEDEEDDVEAVLYALDISGTDVYKGCKNNYDNAVVYVPSWTKHPEIAVKFIKYLFGMED